MLKLVVGDDDAVVVVYMMTTIKLHIINDLSCRQLHDAAAAFSLYIIVTRACGALRAQVIGC